MVSGNLGNIIFVKQFEEFVRDVGYSVTLCRPRDPQTKGKVEEAVRYIKQNFLMGRTYTGIDSLNSACLAWLDREGNGEINLSTKKSPRELFCDEAKVLQPVLPGGKAVGAVFTVSADNYILYKDNRYEIPKSAMLQRSRVRVEEQEDMLLIYRASSNDLVCKHTLLKEIGKTSSLPRKEIELLSEKQAIAFLESSKYGNMFVEELKKSSPRYVDTQLRRLARVLKGEYVKHYFSQVCYDETVMLVL